MSPECCVSYLSLSTLLRSAGNPHQGLLGGLRGLELDAFPFVIQDPLFYLVAVPGVVLLGFSKGGLAGVGSLALPLMVLVIEPVQAARRSAF